jgi:ATP-binding cassette, subfamily B, bacterial
MSSLSTGRTLSVRSFMWQVLSPHRIWLWLAIVVVILASAAGTASSYIFKLIIDAVEADQVDNALLYGLLYPVVVFGIQLTYRLSGYAVAHLTVSVSKTATDNLLAQLFDHSHTYFSNRFAGSVTNKVRNVTGALDQIIPDFIWSQLDTAVTFIVTFALILPVSGLAATAFLFLLSALILINSLMAGKKAELSKLNAETGTELQGRSVDIVSNIAAVRQYVRQGFELTSLKQLTTRKRETGLANWLYTEKMLFLNSVVIFVFNAIMFWLLVRSWRIGEVTTGDFILVVALMSQVVGTMLFVGRAVNATARAFGELREGLDDIYEPYTLTDSDDASRLTVSAGSINWSDVSFKYDNNSVFSNFSLAIPAHQKIGLVGTSGAGKTTFVSLLLRQHELESGVITIDGQNIAKVTQASLRDAVAVVPQEPLLFHRSIFENIAYGKEDATLAEVMAVAKLAHADEFISGLSDGYNTIVGERGIKLSGGQKQRIAIARAMLKNAPILVLDEATSALDSESEHYIQDALRTLMSGKTVIAIAHRLSTLKEMDRIVVLENGRVVEDGNHETLANGPGVYARLWAHQAGGFLIE